MVSDTPPSKSASALELSPPAGERAPYMLVAQTVELEVDFPTKSIWGKCSLMLHILDNDLDEVCIDARQCEIDTSQITVNTFPAQASYADPDRLLRVPTEWNWTAEQHHLQRDRIEALQIKYGRDVPISAGIPDGCQPVNASLKVKIPEEDKDIRIPIVEKINARRKELNQESTPMDDDDRSQCMVTVVVPFRIKDPKDGYHFVGVDPRDDRYPHMFTRHSLERGMACSMFPTIDDSCSTARWKLSVRIPRTLGDAFEQPAAPPHNHELVNGHSNHHHRKPRSHIALSEADKILEMTVVCAGMLTDDSMDEKDESKKTMTFEIDFDNAVGVRQVGFAVGPFQHVDLWPNHRTEEDDEKAGAQALKVHGYCLPGREPEVDNVCGPLVNVADYLMFTVGKYLHWDFSFKLCFVDDMVDDTVPLISFALCSSRMLYRDTVIDNDIDTLRALTRTLAYQWAGIFLLPDTKEDSWVVTGIANYLTELAIKHMCGNNDHRFHMKTLSDRLVEQDVDRPSLHSLGRLQHTDPDQFNFLNLKSSLVMFILDKRLAKKKASKGLVRVLSRLFMKVRGASSDTIGDRVLARCVTSSSFRDRCEKFGDLSLESFWSQWVEGAGCPLFELIQKFNKKRLCVEITVRQVHDPQTERKLAVTAPEKRQIVEPRKFWSSLAAHAYGVEAGKVPSMFTGPLTIKIHEADGTPYEHAVEVREDALKQSRFEIPYNTKYKRIKRNRRQRERLANANQGGTYDAVAGDGHEDRVIYMMGDVLQTREEGEAWGLTEWDEAQEKAMDGESYEWIRFDADFEWISTTTANMPSYMHISQLQQDRDVAAQQESLLYLRDSKPHPLGATFLARTLMDKRYYWKIRVMAATLLTKENSFVGATPHAPGIPHLGAKYLMKAFQELYCFPGTTTARPNNFEDKRDYFVQCAIPVALSKVRDQHGSCPQEVTLFILNQLRFNDNQQNYFSDSFYVSSLIRALATSLVPGDPGHPGSATPKLAWETMGLNERAQAVVEKERIDDCLQELERYRRMDEWHPSYHNLWTISSMEAQSLLMQANVVPKDPIFFIQYLQDDCADDVRIKAFECLSEVGYLFRPNCFHQFIVTYTSVSSPYLREQLFKVLAYALAKLATGEQKIPQETINPKGAGEQVKVKDIDGDVDMDDEDGLELVRSEDVAQQLDIDLKRTETIDGAIEALKHEAKDCEFFKRTLWLAVNAQVLGWFEKRRLLDLCHFMFEKDYSLVVSLEYPRKWSVSRAPPTTTRPADTTPMTHKRSSSKKSAVMNFKSSFRTEPRVKAPPPRPEPVAAPRPEPSRKISLQVKLPSKTSSGPGSAGASSSTGPTVVSAGGGMVIVKGANLPKQPFIKPTLKSGTPKSAAPKSATPKSATAAKPATPRSAATPVPAAVGTEDGEGVNGGAGQDPFSLRPSNPKPHENPIASPTAAGPATPALPTPTSVTANARSPVASKNQRAQSQQRQQSQQPQVNGAGPSGYIGATLSAAAAKTPTTAAKKSRKRARDNSLMAANVERPSKIVKVAFTRFGEVTGMVPGESRTPGPVFHSSAVAIGVAATPRGGGEKKRVRKEKSSATPRTGGPFAPAAAAAAAGGASGGGVLGNGSVNHTPSSQQGKSGASPAVGGGSGGGTGGAKVRKPLPTGLPSGRSSSPASGSGVAAMSTRVGLPPRPPPASSGAPNGNGGGGGGGGGSKAGTLAPTVPRPKIKLKVKLPGGAGSGTPKSGGKSGGDGGGTPRA